MRNNTNYGDDLLRCGSWPSHREPDHSQRLHPAGRCDRFRPIVSGSHASTKAGVSLSLVCRHDQRKKSKTGHGGWEDGEMRQRRDECENANRTAVQLPGNALAEGERAGRRHSAHCGQPAGDPDPSLSWENVSKRPPLILGVQLTQRRGRRMSRGRGGRLWQRGGSGERRAVSIDPRD